MISLGISAFYHDSAAAIVRDGEIIAAAQEERFSRKRHDSGFPHRAIHYCLEEAGVGRGLLLAALPAAEERLDLRDENSPVRREVVIGE